MILSPGGTLEVACLGEKKEVALLKCVIMAGPRGSVSSVIRMEMCRKLGARLCCVLSLHSGEMSEAVLCAFHK